MAGEGFVSAIMSGLGKIASRGAEIAGQGAEVARRSFESMQQRAGDLFRRNNQSNAAHADGTNVSRGRVIEQGTAGTNDTGSQAKSDSSQQPTAPLARRGRVGTNDQPSQTATAVPVQEANPVVAVGVDGRDIGQRGDTKRGAPRERTGQTGSDNSPAPTAGGDDRNRVEPITPVDPQTDTQGSPYSNHQQGPPPPPPLEAIRNGIPSDSQPTGKRVDGPLSEPVPTDQPNTSVREEPTQPRPRENRALAQYQPETQAALTGIAQNMQPEQRTQFIEQFANAPQDVQNWVNGLSPEVVQDANKLNAAIASAPENVQHWVQKFEGPPRIGEAEPSASADDIAKMLEGRTPQEQQAFQQLPNDWQQKVAELTPEQQDKAFEAIMRYNSDTRQAVANFVDNLTPQQRADFIKQFADTPPKVVDWIKDLKPEDLSDSGRFQEILENAPQEVKDWLDKIESNPELQQALEEMRRQLKNTQDQLDLERQKREQEAGKSGSETNEAEATRKAKEAKDAEDDAKRKRTMWILLIAEFTVMYLGLGRPSESSVG